MRDLNSYGVYVTRNACDFLQIRGSAQCTETNEFWIRTILRAKFQRTLARSQSMQRDFMQRDFLLTLPRRRTYTPLAPRGTNEIG